MDDGEKLELYLSALTHCLDPHSSYMSPADTRRIPHLDGARLEGIGAALRQEDGYTVVKRSSPAAPPKKTAA